MSRFIYTNPYNLILAQFNKLLKNFYIGDGKIDNQKRIGNSNILKPNDYIIIMDLDGTLIHSDSLNIEIL